MRDRVTSANVHLGAFPIAQALDRGAQIVVTGRGTDPGLAIGPMIHELGWKPHQHDLLAAGVLRAGIQVVGVAPGVPAESSCFLMLPRDRVHTYADCGVVPEPTSEQHVDVALALVLQFGRELWRVEVKASSRFARGGLEGSSSLAQLRPAPCWLHPLTSDRMLARSPSTRPAGSS